MKVLIASLLLILTATAATAQSAALRKKHYNTGSSGLALDGYDPVAYFTSNKAVKGKKEITAAYQGITYRFASAHNRDLFTARPAQYEPQYGGWCAYAMGAKGEKVSVDPGTFKITGGKLFLFYHKYFNNTLDQWNKDEAHLKANADRHWRETVR